MSRNINLIPMAGAGQRFVDAGYSTPKPLIEVDGKPMILRAAECLPGADQWIFVCRSSHIEEAGIDTSLQKVFPGAQIVAVDKLTEGQACTCLLAKDLISHDDTLTIGPCDNAMAYERDPMVLLESGADALIWTFRNNPAVLQDPKMYGWVETDGGDNSVRVSCKIPVSDDPINDHAIIGAFTFKRAGDFVNCAEKMIAADRRIRNEFYVDEVMNVAIEDGLSVKVFEVDHYVCWGTPADVDLYESSRSVYEKEGL